MSEWKTIHDSLIRIEGKTDDLQEAVSTIRVSQASLPCKLHNQSISTLQRIVYGAVGVILLAFMVGTTTLVIGQANAKPTPCEEVK